MKNHFISLSLIVILAFSYGILSYSAESERKNNIVFYHDGIPAYACTYPSPGLYRIDLKDKKEGIASIRFVFYEPSGKWCGGEITGVHPKDLSGFIETGVLKFWIKSEHMTKDVRVGFTDKLGYTVFKSLRLYSEEITRNWQEIIIPLAEFPKIGSRWDEKLCRKICDTFHWEQVMGFAIDIGKTNKGKCVIYFDNIEVVRR